MRVVIVTGALPARPGAPAGGVAAAVAALVDGLCALPDRPDLHVVVYPWDEDVPATEIGDPPFTLHRLAGPRSGLTLLPGFRPTGRIAALLGDLKPDVVHVQAAAHLVDGRRWPSVLTVHGVRERDALFRRVPFRRLRARLIAAIERPVRRRYRHLIAISGYTAQVLEGRVAGRLHFVANAIDGSFFERRRTESGPRVLFAGSVWPLKNVHTVVEAVGLLARDGVACEFRVAGPVRPPSYEAELVRLVAQWSIADRVTMLGPLDRGALQAEMAAARCLVLTSFQENAPMVVAEAAAMGVPAVVAPAGGAAEMIGGGYAGRLVDPHRPASIADGLRPLMQNAALADTLGERARAMAEAHHPEAVARRTLAVYNRVAAEA